MVGDMFKPVVTPVALVVTAVPSLLQFALPWLEPALRRDPAAIRAGEWWRLITALVVQDGGPYGTLTNLAFLAVLGYVAERAIGPGRWLVLYASGAVAGELSGLLYGQAGAGNSIALCGLAGGLAVLTWRGQTDDRLGAALGAFYAALMAIPAGVTAGAGRWVWPGWWSSWSWPRWPSSSSSSAGGCPAGSSPPSPESPGPD